MWYYQVQSNTSNTMWIFFLWTCKKYFNSLTIIILCSFQRTHLRHNSEVTPRLSRGAQSLVEQMQRYQSTYRCIAVLRGQSAQASKS